MRAEVDRWDSLKADQIPSANVNNVSTPDWLSDESLASFMDAVESEQLVAAI